MSFQIVICFKLPYCLSWPIYSTLCSFDLIRDIPDPVVLETPPIFWEMFFTLFMGKFTLNFIILENLPWRLSYFPWAHNIPNSFFIYSLFQYLLSPSTFRARRNLSKHLIQTPSQFFRFCLHHTPERRRLCLCMVTAFGVSTQCGQDCLGEHREGLWEVTASS